MRPSDARAGLIPGLTGARGLACVVVVLVHVLELTAPSVLARLHLGPSGNAAVTFFFALSAFLLALPLVRAAVEGTRPPALGRYALQRLLRVFPAYLVIFAVADVVLRAVYVTNAQVAAHTRSAGGTGRITDPLRLLEQATLTQNFLPARLQTGVNPAWSLTTEVCFYVLLPAIGLLWRVLVRRGTRPAPALLWPVAALIVLGLVAKVGSAVWQHRSGLSTPAAQYGPHGLAVFNRSLVPLADCFGWGVVAAIGFFWVSTGRLPSWTPRRCRLVCAAVLLGALLVAMTVGSTRPLVSQTAFAVASAAVLMLVTTGTAPGRTNALARVLDVAPLHYLGLVSLSLYLWHYPVLLLAVRHGWIGAASFAGAARSLVVVLVVATALAAVTYHLVERPAQRLAGRRRPVASVPAVG